MELAYSSNGGDQIRRLDAAGGVTVHSPSETAKGDFVSPSRAGQDDGCTPNNILVQVVDAQSGRFIAAFDAFDVDGGWLPAREGDPQASPTTRFH
jgi:hypothetical protein